MRYDEWTEEELDNFHLNIATNIRSEREKKGLTQLDLALAIGHSSAALISKAETNTYNKHFNLEHIYKISKVLEIDPCELIKQKDPTLLHHP